MTRMWEVYFYKNVFDHDDVKVLAPNAKEAIYKASDKIGRGIHQVEKVELVGDTETNRP